MVHFVNWLVIFVCLLLPAGCIIGIVGYILGNKFPDSPRKEAIVSISMLAACIVYFIALHYIFTR